MVTAEDDTDVSSDVSRPKKQDNWLPAFTAVIVVAAALRFYQLDAESLWVDEGFSLRDALTSYDITKFTKPFYYWLLSVWLQLGDSDWFLRLPSAVFGTAAVGVIFSIGRMIWNTKAGTVAGLLAAVSPLQVTHSQEVRMYSLVMLLIAASVYFLIRTLHIWRFRYMAACGICLLLAMFTNPLAVMMLLPFNAAVLDRYLKKRVPLWSWLLVQAVILAYWSPVVPYVLAFHEGYQSQTISRMLERPSLVDIPLIWIKFLTGEWKSSALMYKGSMIYTLGVLPLLLAAIWTFRKNMNSRFIAACLVLPTAGMVVMFSSAGDVWAPRHVLFLSGSVFLLTGAICSRIKDRRLYALMLLFVFSIPLCQLWRYYKHMDRADWKSAVKYITAHQKPGDITAVYRESNEWVFRHYYKGRAHWITMCWEFFLEKPEDEYTEWNTRKALTFLEKVPKRERQWLALSRVPRGAAEAIDFAIRSNYRVLDSTTFKDVRLYLFSNELRN